VSGLGGIEAAAATHCPIQTSPAQPNPNQPSSAGLASHGLLWPVSPEWAPRCCADAETRPAQGGA
jgi:hypothetical protein